MRVMRFYIVLLVLFFSAVAYGQDVIVHGKFLQDSIRIGEPVPYAVSVRYPSEKNILFPDSTSAFGGFEFAYRRYFPTETASGISTDSAVYWINSFEIDSTQQFVFPVFELNGTDTTFYFSSADTIWLQQQVEHIPDSVSAAKLP